jgi:ribosomal-protein-alanine N-acetyltransferase
MENTTIHEDPTVVALDRSPQDAGRGNWRTGLPSLAGKRVVLREIRESDAPALHRMVITDEVARFISAPPESVDGFERFIAWARRQRGAGACAVFAVTLHGLDTAIGLFQIRQLNPAFESAEWGFAISSAFWGTGLFKEAADLVLQFAFETLGIHRLEARACVNSGRGNGALVKVGAVQEGVLRKSFLRDGQYFDQFLYSFLVEDWRVSRRRGRFAPSVQVH